jgi:hypothetical protein
MPYPTAAGFLAAYGTGYYSFKQRAGLQPGEHVLIGGLRRPGFFGDSAGQSDGRPGDCLRVFRLKTGSL